MITRESINKTPFVREAVARHGIDLRSANAAILNYDPQVMGVSGNAEKGYVIKVIDSYHMIPELEIHYRFEGGDLVKPWKTPYQMVPILNTPTMLLNYLYSTDRDVYKRAEAVTTEFMVEQGLLANERGRWTFPGQETVKFTAEGYEGYDSKVKRQFLRPFRKKIKNRKARR